MMGVSMSIREDREPKFAGVPAMGSNTLDAPKAPSENEIIPDRRRDAAPVPSSHGPAIDSLRRSRRCRVLDARPDADI